MLVTSFFPKNIDSIVTDIESGIYTNSVNAQGEWVGAESVKNAVLAVCGAKVMEMDKANAEKNRTQYIWQNNASDKKTRKECAAVKGTVYFKSYQSHALILTAERCGI